MSIDFLFLLRPPSNGITSFPFFSSIHTVCIPFFSFSTHAPICAARA